MKKNVGPADRGFRVVLGLVIMSFGYFNNSYWGFVGLIPLLTATFRWCPAYTLVGFSSCKTGKDSSESSLN